MGVPAMFRFLSKKYPKIITPVIEESSKDDEDGVQIPIDTSGPNPNGKEFDNLYLDMNGIVHPCSHPENKPPPETEEDMMLEVFKYTDRVIAMVRPRKLLMIAIDGVAPRAKMNQQRSRRFRTARESKEKEEDTKRLIAELEASGKPVHESLKNQKKAWDSNAITPGTPFMDILSASLRYWVQKKQNNDPGWKNLKIIISDAGVPGEGEHKIMEFVRSQRTSRDHNPNTRHVIYGLDADLIMLGLATHEPHFRVLREDVFFQDASSKGCRICSQMGHFASECSAENRANAAAIAAEKKAGEVSVLKPFIWLHVDILREYLAVELDPEIPDVKFDLERAIDDWVFLCFFVGNDFLPHLPSLDIREGAIDMLTGIWKANFKNLDGYLTTDGTVNLDKAQIILDAVAVKEARIFENRRRQEARRDENQKRRKLEVEESQRKIEEMMMNQPNSMPAGQATVTRGAFKNPTMQPPDLSLLTPLGTGRIDHAQSNSDIVANRKNMRMANLANKSAAASLKAQLLGNVATESDGASETTEDKAEDMEDVSISPSGKKRKADELIADNGEVSDDVRLWEEGFKDRYYEQKLHKDYSDNEFRREFVKSYVEGLCWVLLYYYQGCPSWTWYYPYHYAPFAADFERIDEYEINFDLGTPFRPFEQLMGVLPAASKAHLPENFQKLMTEEDSEILDFYPENFPIDMNGKKFAWQGVALLPFIDEIRLLKALERPYHSLTEEERLRNAVGHDVLFVSDGSKLYDELAMNLYSKRKLEKPFKITSKLSKGLAGYVMPDESFIPNSTIQNPLLSVDLEDIVNNRVLCVKYKIPKSKYVHKSMLLKGVQMNPPVLTSSELWEVKTGKNSTFRDNDDNRGSNRRGRGGYRGGRNGNNSKTNSPASSGYNQGPSTYGQSPSAYGSFNQSPFGPGSSTQTFSHLPQSNMFGQSSWNSYQAAPGPAYSHNAYSGASNAYPPQPSTQLRFDSGEGGYPSSSSQYPLPSKHTRFNQDGPPSGDDYDPYGIGNQYRHI
ncbi:5'-3' exoribonuclease 2 [Neolecta irregularis DAH-3]|uniref:5'-3' exoribonuclease n=1 Tax=Neolecta irregularis (strain DAH-3) TaxID=1198029 RepID=A0A1U7LJ67_NEOID|nr:5'-3' exoribonuclease 2 [Neolecta irregularis DAH-3]|eukprot:OLL22700.1 5'-3' exoribonuclease 2 [Neolecta irregularis DAH-3]